MPHLNVLTSNGDRDAWQQYSCLRTTWERLSFADLRGQTILDKRLSNCPFQPPLSLGGLSAQYAGREPQDVRFATSLPENSRLDWF
jgi:hypothetical protein